MASRFKYLLAVLLIGSYSLSAAGFPDTPLKASLDFAQFRYQEGEIYLELYYAVGVDQLTYASQDGQFKGALILHTQVVAAKDQQTVANRQWHIPHQIEDPSETHPGENIVGVIGLAIPDANHILKAIFLDENDPSRKDSTTFELTGKGFNEGLPALSDVELCSSLRKAPKDPTNVFYKNTYEVIPLPSRIYDSGKPVLFYYAEAYNLLSGNEEDSYYLDTEVYDSEGQVVLSSNRYRPRVHESSVEVGTMNVHELSAGTYTFRLSIGDSTTGLIASSSKTFYVYRPGEMTDMGEGISGASLEDEYRRMGEEELDEESALLLYIMPRSERGNYRKLSSADAKRAFLYEFWERRNPISENAVDEYRREYLRRVENANQQFSAGIRKGWQTDRGRVLIIYGEPDNIDRSYYRIDQKPYEIWTYDTIQGGIYFVFIDETGFNDYMLVHSTARNELRDTQWQSRLDPGR